MNENRAREISTIDPHRFVESGPGQEPTTIRGCIVCPDCYQPKRSMVHTSIADAHAAALAANEALSGPPAVRNPYAGEDPYADEAADDRPLYHTAPEGPRGMYAAVFTGLNETQPVNLSVANIDGDFMLTSLSRVDTWNLVLALLDALAKN